MKINNFSRRCADCQERSEEVKETISDKRRRRTKSNKYPEKTYHSPPNKKKKVNIYLFFLN